MTLGVGIHDGVPADVYHADPCERPSLSSSMTKLLIATSPAHVHAAHPRLNPDAVATFEQKFDVGTAAHALLLEGDESAVEVIVADDWRTKAAKEARAAARLAGRTPLLAKDWDRVRAMTAAIRAQLDLVATNEPPAFFADGKPEQTIVWEDNGVLCRARLDWLTDTQLVIDDFKSTGASANPVDWARTMLGFGADIQARFYQRGVRNLTGREPQFRFVVAETSPPYVASVVSLAPSMAALADEKIAFALEVWARCLKAGDWPGFTPRIHHLESPAWAESQWLARDVAA